MAVRGLMTGDLGDASFLHLLALVHGHQSINKLLSIENGNQDAMVNGGAGSIAQRVAAELGDAVHLAAPVRTIAQRGERVDVTADGVSVSATHVVVACPPALTLEIAFDPPLADDRVALN